MRPLLTQPPLTQRGAVEALAEPMGTASGTIEPARPRARSAWLALGSIAALVLSWQALSWVAGDPRLLPPPAEVARTLLRTTLSGELPSQLAATLARVVAGFTLAMTLGSAIGLLLGRSRLADALGGPWLLIFLNLPALVVIILAYVWVGLNDTAAILAVAISKIPNVAVQVREGARALDRGLDDMARVFGIGPWRRLRDIHLPQLAPHLLGAARSGLALVWKIVLVVELLGRPNGVGFEIGNAFQLFDVASLLAYGIAFLLVVLAIEVAVMQPLAARVGQWRA